MTRLLPPILDGPNRCSYLPGRDATLEYRYAVALDAPEYADRMLRGWRHFGRMLFRPRCPGCDACRPLRVDVDRFRPDRSQRRAWAANRDDLRIEVAAPAAGPEQVGLYRRYHAHQAAAKDWPDRRAESVDDYREAFVDNPFPAEEWRYTLGGSLVAIGYVDPLPVGPSAVTFFYDPDHRGRSLGTYNVLALIDAARRLGQPHVYLGYYVAGCPSLEYKARFGPNQVLGPDGRWRDFEG